MQRRLVTLRVVSVVLAVFAVAMAITNGVAGSLFVLAMFLLILWVTRKEKSRPTLTFALVVSKPMEPKSVAPVPKMQVSISRRKLRVIPTIGEEVQEGEDAT